VRELVGPTSALYGAWLACHEDWGSGLHEDGFGILPSDEVDSEVGFSAWVQRLVAQSDEHQPAGLGRHRCVYRWIIEDQSVNGGIALRYGTEDEYTRWAGHIGFGIRPSARGGGLATWALQAMLAEAAELGMDRVLLVCEADNVPSVRTIERCGGELEAVHDGPHGPLRRYWITTS
jgi:predicted acetyltransferase